MTQDEYKCLVVRIVDRINEIEKGQQYLEIVLEQLSNPTDKTSKRVELLVATYLSVADCMLDDLKSDCRKLKRKCNTETVDD
jgi:hypothetical protein